LISCHELPCYVAARDPESAAKIIERD